MLRNRFQFISFYVLFFDFYVVRRHDLGSVSCAGLFHNIRSKEHCSCIFFCVNIKSSTYTYYSTILGLRLPLLILGNAHYPPGHVLPEPTIFRLHSSPSCTIPICGNPQLCRIVGNCVNTLPLLYQK